MAGVKYDAGKNRLDLWPVGAYLVIGQVLTAGATKYDDNNWQIVENASNRYYAAALRHLTAWRLGELNDEETGLPHLAHACCCLVFLLSKQIGFDPKAPT